MRSKLVGMLQGGLGNQLFIYFTLSKYCNQLGLRLCLNLSYYQYDKYNRNNGLDKIGLPYCEDRSFRFRNKFARKVLLMLRKSKVVSKVFPNVFFEKKYNEYLEFKLSSAKKSYMVGYFQHPKYIDKTQVDLAMKDIPIKRECNALVSRLYDRRRVIALHLRSYLETKSPESEQVSRDYIEEALLSLSYSKEHDTILVFTDSQSFAEQILVGYDFEIFDKGCNLSPEETLFSLSEFERIICSNSSFSWWAAYISSSTNVVYPKNKGFTYYPEPDSNWIQI